MMESENSQEELAVEDVELLQAEEETESPESSFIGTGGAGVPRQPNNPDALGLRDLAAELRDEFNMAGEKLDKHARNVNIARVVGGSTALAGGITAIVGFALIPVTMGLSALVAGIVGASIAAAGGMAAGGASAAKIFIEKFNLNPLTEKWSAFQESLRTQLQENDPEAYQRMQDHLKAQVGGAVGAAGAAAGALGASAAAARTGIVAARALTAEAAAAARVATAFAAGSIVLNAALIGINVFDIIDGSLELYRQTGSKAGDYLRQLATSLDEFAGKGLTEDFLKCLF